MSRVFNRHTHKKTSQSNGKPFLFLDNRFLNLYTFLGKKAWFYELKTSAAKDGLNRVKASFSVSSA